METANQENSIEMFKYTYMHLLDMATKTITITNEAYERLASFKENNESFSDVVIKLTNKNSMAGLIGIIPKEAVAELRNSIKETRKRMDAEIEKTAARLQ